MKNKIIPLFNIPSQISPEESELLRKREELLDDLLEIFNQNKEFGSPYSGGKIFLSNKGRKEAWKLIVSMNVQFGEN